jgi:tellurium resistance protein TerD
MGVKLQKGQKVDLTKGNPSLDKIIVGLGWDEQKYGAHDFDLDASVFMLGTQKVLSDEDFIFYNKLESDCGSVVHTGDNLTGDGDGDDEQVIVCLNSVPTKYNKISFAVTIHDAEKRMQNFGQVANAFVRIVDQTTDEEILRYDLGEEFSVETAVVVCEIYRHNGEWKFSAVGGGFQGGLESLCKNFGVSV